MYVGQARWSVLVHRSVGMTWKLKVFWNEISTSLLLKEKVEDHSLEKKIEG